MDNRPRSERERDILAEPEKARLLERASQLDVARSSGAEVRELRAAAMEAGISTVAFDAALAEIRESEPAKAAARRNRRKWMWIEVASAVAFIAGLVLALNRGPANSGVREITPLIDQTVTLRCVSPSEAAELIRPIMNLQENEITLPPNAPHILRVRATLEQIQKVRATLDEKETGAGSLCAAPKAP